MTGRAGRDDFTAYSVGGCIEVLRDPSHARMLSGSELVDLITHAGVAIDRQESWDRAREFEEWAGIVNNPKRVAPLRTLSAPWRRPVRTRAWVYRCAMGPFIFSIDGNWFAAPNARARETAPETSTVGRLLACRSWDGPRSDAATTSVAKSTMPADRRCCQSERARHHLPGRGRRPHMPRGFLRFGVPKIGAPTAQSRPRSIW